MADAESITLQGGCLCGRVRYEVRPDSDEGYYCHCRMCQLAFGNTRATFINVLQAGADLLQFFAIFYTVTQGVTFLAQIAVSRVVMTLGIGRSVGSLHAGVAGATSVALLFPTFPMLLIARGTEHVLRGSLFRSGYELLFNPLAPEGKRRTKAFLDVACYRAGDALGATVVQMFLFVGPGVHHLGASSGVDRTRRRRRLDRDAAQRDVRRRRRTAADSGSGRTIYESEE